MQKRTKLILAGATAMVVLAPITAIALSERLEFIAGGGLIDLGYRLQDHLESYDLSRHNHPAPAAIWAELLDQNALATAVRRRYPRSTHHPTVAMVVCMDARIDTNEIVGDTRKYYYVVRTAGSVMSEREEEMLELAVVNGVHVVVLTTHTDCAAEHLAADPEQRARYPHLAAGVAERMRRQAEFMARPFISARIASGALIVRHALIDTHTGRLTPQP